VITAACWLTSLAAMVVVAVRGPSAAVPNIPGSAAWPPYFLANPPTVGHVFAIEAVAVLAGAVAAWRMITAAGRGRGLRPWRLQAAGFLAAAVLTVLPPLGSEDLLSYLAYGQLSAAGIDPYAYGPQSPGVPQDAITRAIHPPWQTTPSVYGPVFTRISTAIAHVAHGDGHVAATLTRLLLTGGFVVTGVVLFRLAGTDTGRRRVAALWTANPLLLYALVAGAHLDALLVAVLVCAIAVVRRSPLAAGLLAGLAATLKLNGLIVLPGLLWAVRARPRSALALAAGTAAVAVPWYLAAPGVLAQLRIASRYTTPATPWRTLAVLLEPTHGYAGGRWIVTLVAGGLGLALIALLLWRRLPPADDTPVGRACAVTAAFALGWLLTAPYVLPWYDALAWAPLALVGASFLDRVLLVHTTVLVLAFLPGRDIPLAGALRTAQLGLHTGLSPVVVGVLVLVTVALASRRRPTGPPGPPLRPGLPALPDWRR
jgi:alpha-1,6-mannosyltransferase